MCNSCNNNGCGCNNGWNQNSCNNCYDPLLAALTNLFAPIGCGCRTCGNNGSLVLVNSLGGNGRGNGCGCQQNNGCGCGNNNGLNTLSGFNGFGQNGWNNGCGCQQNNGCGCRGNTYDAYYVRQYALNSCCCNN